MSITHSAFVGEFIKQFGLGAVTDKFIALTRDGVDPEGQTINAESLAPATDKAFSINAVGNLRITDKFKLGAASLKELEGVHQGLVDVVKLAIRITTQDFTVYDGIRTVKEQANHVKNGTSKTMKSKHLEGLAVDLVPWINGRPVWDWTGCYKIAHAMDCAATHLGYADKIRWGGAWDRVLSDFGGNPDHYEDEVQEYMRRHAGPDFLDGPHYEWVG